MTECGNGRYTVYLIGIALAGLTLASSDYNLLVPDIPPGMALEKVAT